MPSPASRVFTAKQNLFHIHPSRLPPLSQSAILPADILAGSGGTVPPARVQGARSTLQIGSAGFTTWSILSARRPSPLPEIHPQILPNPQDMFGLFAFREPVLALAIVWQKRSPRKHNIKLSG